MDSKEYYEEYRKSLNDLIESQKKNDLVKLISLYLHCYKFDSDTLKFIKELIDSREISNLEMALAMLEHSKTREVKSKYDDTREGW